MKKYQLKSRDIVIMGTDGLFNNINNEEMIESIKNDNLKKAEDVAKKLTETAYNNSINQAKRSPYQEELEKAIADGDGYAMDYEGHQGRKPDDMAVIVAIIK